MPTCTTCNAPILFAITAKGHRIPINPTPVKNGKGNIKLIANPGGFPAAVTVPEGQGTHVSHFVTCTNPKAHRKSDRKKAQHA